MERLILEDRAIECSASATLPLSGTVLYIEFAMKSETNIDNSMLFALPAAQVLA